jgi:hypothetical protein
LRFFLGLRGEHLTAVLILTLIEVSFNKMLLQYINFQLLSSYVCVCILLPYRHSIAKRPQTAHFYLFIFCTQLLKQMKGILLIELFDSILLHTMYVCSIYVSAEYVSETAVR